MPMNSSNDGLQIILASSDEAMNDPSKCRRAPRSIAAAMMIVACIPWAATEAAIAAAPADSTHSSATPTTVHANPPVPHLFTRGDLLFLGGTIAATSLAVREDQWLTDQAVQIENNSGQRRLAETFQPLGQNVYILGAAGATYLAAQIFDQPRVARRAARVGLAVMIASTVTFGLKEAVGRARPENSPHQSANFRPFSGDLSFPSGHAATAFAAAVALDRETESRWVPYIVYPAATLVAWSRVHDRKHWTSDVVAGAAIGGWTAWKMENFLANRALGVPPQPGEPVDEPAMPKKHALWIVPVPEPGGGSLTVVKTF